MRGHLPTTSASCADTHFPSRLCFVPQEFRFPPGLTSMSQAAILLELPKQSCKFQLSVYKLRLQAALHMQLTKQSIERGGAQITDYVVRNFPLLSRTGNAFEAIPSTPPFKHRRSRVRDRTPSSHTTSRDPR